MVGMAVEADTVEEADNVPLDRVEVLGCRSQAQCLRMPLADEVEGCPGVGTAGVRAKEGKAAVALGRPVVEAVVAGLIYPSHHAVVL